MDTKVSDDVLEVTPFEESDAVEADIHGDDGVLAEGEQGVDARLAVGIVAPVQVNGATEDECVQAGVNHAVTEPALLVLSEGRASADVVQEGGHKVGVRENHKTGE